MNPISARASRGHQGGEAPRSSNCIFHSGLNLPPSGIFDRDTWSALLSEVPSLAQDILGDIMDGRVPSTGGRNAAARSSFVDTPSPSPSSPTRGSGTSVDPDALAAAMAAVAVEQSQLPQQQQQRTVGGAGGGGGSGWGDVLKDLDSWPTLQDGDGGRMVRVLQVRVVPGLGLGIQSLLPVIVSTIDITTIDITDLCASPSVPFRRGRLLPRRRGHAVVAIWRDNSKRYPHVSGGALIFE